MSTALSPMPEPRTGLTLVPEPALDTGGLPARLLRASEATNPGAALDLVVVVEPQGDTSAEALERLLVDHTPTIRRLIKDHGNVLFRGFDVERTAFEAMVSQAFEADRYLWMFPMAPKWARLLLALPLVGWMTRALLGWIEARATGREIVEEKLSTLANDQTIQFPHHEYGIFFNVPRIIAFYCDEEAGEEGETILCDARSGYEAMSAEVREKFETTRFIRYRSENQWYLPPFTAPPILFHPEDDYPTMNFTAYHHEVFAEAAREAFPNSTITTDELDETFTFTPTFMAEGGGEHTLDTDDVADISRAHLERVVLLPWHQGDVLLMDNFKVVHGRLNAGTPKKRLQVILCDYVRNQNRFTR